MEINNRFNPDCLSEVTTLLDSFPNPVVIIGTDYRILGTNRSYNHRFGASGNVAGRTCFDVSHHFDNPCHEMGEECPMQASLATGEPQRVLHLHHSPEGEEHVDVEACPIRNSRGEITAVIEIIRTIKSERDEQGKQKLIGRSAAFNRTLELIGRVAPSDSAVLLLGESGTGKELAAHAVHKASNRTNGPFVPVDCSGLTESLFESELFGHEKGAFTGAHSRKQGLIEAARGGTLFLDEIGDVPLNLQVKLLRLLETGTFRRVGSVEVQQAEFRLVCATHRNLHKMVEDGSFRRDLFYRISAFPIDMPSLNERLDDLPALAESLLKRLRPERKMRISDEAMACLRAYHYPGNIRELRNILERALLLSDNEVITCDQLPAICKQETVHSVDETPQFSQLVPLDSLERHYLRWAVASHQGDKRSLADKLGVSERTLYRKLEKALQQTE